MDNAYEDRDRRIHEMLKMEAKEIKKKKRESRIGAVTDGIIKYEIVLTLRAIRRAISAYCHLLALEVRVKKVDARCKESALENYTTDYDRFRARMEGAPYTPHGSHKAP